MRNKSASGSRRPPSVFSSDIEDEYLRRLGAQYNRAITSTKNGRLPSQNFPRTEKKTHVEQYENGRSKKKVHADLHELASKKRATDYERDREMAKGDNREQYDDQRCGIALKPAMPPVKKMVRNLSFFIFFISDKGIRRL